MYGLQVYGNLTYLIACQCRNQSNCVIFSKQSKLFDQLFCSNSYLYEFQGYSLQQQGFIYHLQCTNSISYNEIITTSKFLSCLVANVKIPYSWQLRYKSLVRSDFLLQRLSVAIQRGSMLRSLGCSNLNFLLLVCMGLDVVILVY